MEQLLIGRLAKLAGVTADTIRFYERSGLLPKPARGANGYRVYAQVAVDQVRFIKKAQSLGFSLDEIKRILGLRGQGRTTCRCVVSMAEATLEESERKLKETQRFVAALRSHLQDWRKQAGPGKRMAADFCRLIESS